MTSRNSVWQNSKNLLYRELNTGKLTPNQNRKTPTTYFPFIVLVQINLVWPLVNHLSTHVNYQDLASFTLQPSFCFIADMLTKKVGFRRLGSILKQNVMTILAPFCCSQNISKGRKHFRYILCIIFHEYWKPLPNAWPPSCPWIMVKMPTATHRADLSEADVTLVGVPGSHTLSFGFDYSIKHLFPCSRPIIAQISIWTPFLDLGAPSFPPKFVPIHRTRALVERFDTVFGEVKTSPRF